MDLLTSHWWVWEQDYYPHIEKEKCLKDVEKNSAGARPKELFEDALELADAQFEKDKAKLKDVVKDHDLTVDADTTFDAFNKALEYFEEVKGIIKPNRCALCMSCLIHSHE